MTTSGVASFARDHLHRTPPEQLDDALVAATWTLARFLGRAGESLRLDLRQPDAILETDDVETWGAYWPGFDRAELSYRERHGLSCDGPIQAHILLGRPSGAVRACRRAATRLRARTPLDADDLMALLTLLHELHHASSASGLAGQDYALAYDRGWAIEEGFVHGMSVRRLTHILGEVGAPLAPGALALWRAWVTEHPLEVEYRRVRRLCAGRDFEAGWRAFRRAALLERLYFCAAAPAPPSRVREKRALAAA